MCSCLRTYAGLRHHPVLAKDTHLHASVQRRLEELEVQRQFNKRKEDPGRVPKLSRADIVDLVAEMWMGLDHNSFSRTGYLQTGPTLPMNGDGDANIYKDLIPFWNAMEGQKFREACHALLYVRPCLRMYVRAYIGGMSR